MNTVDTGFRSRPEIGRLVRVPLREVWKHEAYDFTTWLQENIDVLNDTLGLSLENVEREQSAGAFNMILLLKMRPEQR